ncbi:4Fe-4S binding protein [bacterium]|nr:4Fe-4S binding protein [bacterium]
MSKPRYLSKDVSLSLDTQKCIGCGTCTQVCPHEVFAVDSGKATVIDHDACMECGACALNCPVEAIFVDAGVGCASAIIIAALLHREPSCGCCCGDKKSD